MRAGLSLYLPDDQLGQGASGSIDVDITRHQIGDRMASDYYVQFIDPVYDKPVFAIPFRQLKNAVDEMIKRGVWE